jgi:hypothetical protein
VVSFVRSHRCVDTDSVTITSRVIATQSNKPLWAPQVLASLCNFTSSSNGVVDWEGPVPTSAVMDSSGSITVSWSTADIFLNGTRDCWECCTATGGGAHDIFQVSTKFPQPNGDEREQEWVNTTFVFDPDRSTVKINPVTPAAKEPYVVVRYGASLWPQCAVYKVRTHNPRDSS